MRVQVDTREQRPWTFDSWGVDLVPASLPTGDYCLPGDEYRFVIERKSGSDFLGSISSDWPRFRREMARGVAVVVVVEAPLADFLAQVASGRIVPSAYTSQLPPGMIYRRVADILAIPGCSIFPAAGREEAEAAAWTILAGRHAERERNRKEPWQ